MYVCLCVYVCVYIFSEFEFPVVIDSKIGVALGIILGSFNVEGSSVNDFIPKEISVIQYATIQDAIRLTKQQVDIESAFRIIPVSPLDRLLLGFQWKGKFSKDAVLPMGVSSACAIFKSFSTKMEFSCF